MTRVIDKALKMIVPRHKELCNKFISWLDSTGRVVLGREKNRVDLEFRDGTSFCRAELKMGALHGAGPAEMSGVKMKRPRRNGPRPSSPMTISTI